MLDSKLPVAKLVEACVAMRRLLAYGFNIDTHLGDFDIIGLTIPDNLESDVVESVSWRVCVLNDDDSDSDTPEHIATLTGAFRYADESHGVDVTTKEYTDILTENWEERIQDSYHKYLCDGMSTEKIKDLNEKVHAIRKTLLDELIKLTSTQTKENNDVK